jgi:hypothetical protein
MLPEFLANRFAQGCDEREGLPGLSPVHLWEKIRAPRGAIILDYAANVPRPASRRPPPGCAQPAPAHVFVSLHS